MKRRSFLGLLSLVAMGLSAGCSTSSDNIAEPRYSLHFKVTTSPTRTTIEGRDLRWVEGDEISFFWDDPLDPRYAAGHADPATGRIAFNASLTAKKTEPLVFFYPYDPAGQLTIPKIQTQAKAGELVGKYLPMVSQNIADEEVAFDGAEYTIRPVVRLWSMASIVRFRVVSADPDIQKERILSIAFSAGDGSMVAGANPKIVADRLSAEYADFPQDADFEDGLISGSSEAEVRISEKPLVGAGDNADRAVYLSVVPGIHKGKIEVRTDRNTYWFDTGAGMEFRAGHIKPIVLNLKREVPLEKKNFVEMTAIDDLGVVPDTGATSGTQILILNTLANRVLARSTAFTAEDLPADATIPAAEITLTPSGEITPEEAARAQAEIITLGWDEGTDRNAVRYAAYSLLTDYDNALKSRLMCTAWNAETRGLAKVRTPFGFAFDRLSSGNAVWDLVLGADGKARFTALGNAIGTSNTLIYSEEQNTFTTVRLPAEGIRIFYRK